MALNQDSLQNADLHVFIAAAAVTAVVQKLEHRTLE
jgi:hypothetical protein